MELLFFVGIFVVFSTTVVLLCRFFFCFPIASKVLVKEQTIFFFFLNQPNLRPRIEMRVEIAFRRETREGK